MFPSLEVDVEGQLKKLKVDRGAGVVGEGGMWGEGLVWGGMAGAQQPREHSGSALSRALLWSGRPSWQPQGPCASSCQ